MNQIDQNIQYLLRRVHETAEEHASRIRESGENFNIFKILKLTSNEVRTHSAFIAELLNPKGSHGFGDKFLNIFLKVIDLKGFHSFTAKVYIEKSIGVVSEDFSRGGRLDILVEDGKGMCFIIENKIYASEGIRQLERYVNYAKDNYAEGKSKVIYLTLFPDHSKNEMHGFQCISYSNSIIEWLSKCMDAVTDKPIVKEGILHYFNLIKYLTNQNISNDMNKDLVKIILESKETLNAAFLVNQAIIKAQYEIINILFNQLNVLSEKRNDLKFEFVYLKDNPPSKISKEQFGNQNTGVLISSSNFKNKEFSIGIIFNEDCKSLYYGIYSPNCLIPNNFKPELPSDVDEPDNHWPWYKWFEYKGYPKTNEDFLSIYTGEMITKLNDNIDMLVSAMLYSE